jgi:hypothetical protein
MGLLLVESAVRLFAQYSLAPLTTVLLALLPVLLLLV